jgi:hypothetical protein
MPACEDSDTSFILIAGDGALEDPLEVLVTVDQSSSPPQIVSPDTLELRSGTAWRYYPEITDPDDTEHLVSYLHSPAWCQIVNDSLMGEVPPISGWDSVRVSVADFCSADTAEFVICTYVCGDANGDTSINISDAVFLIQFIFNHGAPPQPLDAGDATCDGPVNISDAVYLITYIFGSGPSPCADCP